MSTRRKGHLLGSGASWRFLIALGAAACLVAIAVSSAGATTGPGAVYTLRAIMTNSKITLVRTKGDAPYIEPGGTAATFQRGAVINFSVTNKGTRALLPAVQALSTANENPLDHALKYYTASHSILPGGREDLQIDFYFRAPFALLELFHKKPVGKRVQITVQ
jgi:hypothetical protein